MVGVFPAVEIDSDSPLQGKGPVLEPTSQYISEPGSMTGVAKTIL